MKIFLGVKEYPTQSDRTRVVIAMSFLYFNHRAEEESRYLLIIAEDIGVRRLVIELCRNNGLNPEVVHGSGFSGDKNFTQVSCVGMTSMYRYCHCSASTEHTECDTIVMFKCLTNV